MDKNSKLTEIRVTDDGWYSKKNHFLDKYENEIEN